MPQLPSSGTVSRTELIPFRSKKINIKRSGILAPGLATVLLCVFLFTGRGNTPEGTIYLTIYGIGSYIIFMTFWLIYSYSGTNKPLWVYAFPCIFTVAIVSGSVPGVWFGLATVFRNFLPGGSVPSDAAFHTQFISFFFGAGLLEELVKAIPIFIGVGIALALARSRQPNAFFNYLAVRTPLDAMLIGLASGAGFVAIETFFEYVPRIVNNVQRQTNDQAAALLFGLRLVIPRTLQSLAGHTGWSAIFGYFIGLAMVRRASWVQLIVIGWLSAAVIHGLWNSVDAISNYGFYVVALAGFGLFVACLLKARQLEPLLTGQPARVGHSILVVPPRPAGPPPLPFGPQASPYAPPPVQAWTAAQANTAPLSLLVEGTRIQLAQGGRVDLGTHPTLGSRGAGIIAEVTSHPSDPSIVGLKNLGEQTWSATSADGSPHSVPPRRILRIDAGTRINFGPVFGDVHI